jgi:hypothetical protein
VQDGHDLLACHPGRSLSLWDIMHTFRGPEIAYVIRQIQEKRCHCHRLRFLEAGGEKANPDYLDETTKFFKEIEDICEDCGFESARAKSSLTYTHYTYRHADAPIDISTIEADLRNIEDMLFSDLFKRRYLIVAQDRVKYLESDVIFGEAVATAFPSAKRDLREAGNCLASDCKTAAVFHMMRAVEWGLRALAVDLGVNRLRTRNKRTSKARFVPLAWSDWEHIINTLRSTVEKRIARLSKGPNKQLYQEFYLPNLQEIQSFRDVWRNHVMHTRSEYDAPEAEVILGHVKSLMVRLATRVSEV